MSSLLVAIQTKLISKSFANRSMTSTGSRVSDILCKRGSFTAEAFFPQT